MVSPVTSSESLLIATLEQSRQKRKRANKRWIAVLTEHLQRSRGVIGAMMDSEPAGLHEELIMDAVAGTLLRNVDYLASLDVRELRAHVSLTVRAEVLELSRRMRSVRDSATPERADAHPELREAFARLTPLEKEATVRFLYDESPAGIAGRAGVEDPNRVLVRSALRALSRLSQLLPDEFRKSSVRD
jgi:hypothetical protein